MLWTIVFCHTKNVLIQWTIVWCHITQDVLELLEKRVKSRFSHRQIHLSPGYSFDGYVSLFQSYLTLPKDADIPSEFTQSWNLRVEVSTHTLSKLVFIDIYILNKSVYMKSMSID